MDYYYFYGLFLLKTNTIARRVHHRQRKNRAWIVTPGCSAAFLQGAFL